MIEYSLDRLMSTNLIFILESTLRSNFESGVMFVSASSSPIKKKSLKNIPEFDLGGNDYPRFTKTSRSPTY